jgi:hypothetical protein
MRLNFRTPANSQGQEAVMEFCLHLAYESNKDQWSVQTRDACVELFAKVNSVTETQHRFHQLQYRPVPCNTMLQWVTK